MFHFLAVAAFAMSFNINNSRCFAFAVLGAIFLQTISTMSVAYGSSSYYVIAFERRGKDCKPYSSTATDSC